MAGNDGLRAEITELEALLTRVQTDGNRRDLRQLLERKQQQLERLCVEENKPNDPVASPMDVEETPEIPRPAPVKVGAHAPKPADVGEDLNVYTEISRFGWEDEGYGKDKVTVHILSGVDGVGELPQENVTCKFTADSFDLKIIGLHGKNYRLVKNYLDKEINPTKSSFRVKKNRVTISLWKKDKNNSWMNLTAKNPQKQNRPNSSDPAAGIMDMMKEMYDQGDDEMKRTIAKAWSESREKRDAGEL